MTPVSILLKPLKTNKGFLFSIVFLFLGGLFFIRLGSFTPKLESPLPSPTQKIPLSTSSSPSSIEYQVAEAFLKAKDYTPTLTGFKKAELIASSSEEASQALYGLIYTQFLAKKWKALTVLYKEGALSKIPQEAPYFRSACLIFYKALQEEKTPFLLTQLESFLIQDPSLQKALVNTKILIKADFKDPLFTISPYKEGKTHFEKQLKSPPLAQFFNLCIPGLGYLYLGQFQSALTAFLICSLLFWAIQKAFSAKQIASALLLLSIVSGFYWGSVVGVKEASRFYNESLFKTCFEPLALDEGLFIEDYIDYAP